MSVNTNHKNGNGLPLAGENGASVATAVAANRLNFGQSAEEEIKFPKTLEAETNQNAPDESIEPDEAIETSAEDGKENRGSGRRTKWLIVGLTSIFLFAAMILFARSCATRETKKLPISTNQQSAPTQPTFNPEQAANALTETTRENKSGNLSSFEPSNSTVTPETNNIFLPTSDADVPVTRTSAENNSALNGGDANTNSSLNTANLGETGGSNSSLNTGDKQANPVSKTSGASSNVAANPKSENSNQLPDSMPARQASYFLFGANVVNAISNTSEQSPFTTTGTNANRPTFKGNTAAKRPPFGTVLPLQTLGAIDTLRPRSLVRMVLTRSVSGVGWNLPRGTIFVGNTAGGTANRAYVNVVGFLDNKENALIRLSGEINGLDGASGIKGERKSVGNRWLKALRQIAAKSWETANTWLSGRGGGSVTRIEMPNGADFGIRPESDGQIKYVYVAPGSFAYLTITDLPDEVQAEIAPLPADSETSANYLSESELVGLLTTGNANQIRAALPRIAPEMRGTVEELLRTGGIKNERK